MAAARRVAHQGGQQRSPRLVGPGFPTLLAVRLGARPTQEEAVPLALAALAASAPAFLVLWRVGPQQQRSRLKSLRRAFAPVDEV